MADASCRAPRRAYPPLFEGAEELCRPAGSWIGTRAAPEPIGPRAVPLRWPTTESGRNRRSVIGAVSGPKGEVPTYNCASAGPDWPSGNSLADGGTCVTVRRGGSLEVRGQWAGLLVLPSGGGLVARQAGLACPIILSVYVSRGTAGDRHGWQFACNEEDAEWRAVLGAGPCGAGRSWGLVVRSWEWPLAVRTDVRLCGLGDGLLAWSFFVN
ncbi:hypothetical protein NDU88_002768 [Pleurodeles waltl]|uniref:Uncharacterized protein n=1 Tax=Pleurodeles waltl TaxID=8319 RepID=A0AAV7M1M5_PLEWA|nr:hypothetical protein NDU88_002768 [Pleurodeles waltl]